MLYETRRVRGSSQQGLRSTFGQGAGDRTGTKAISCGCAACGPAVAAGPQGSWILHQWKRKGPPIRKV